MKIAKRKKIPEGSGMGRPGKYPWHKLKVGDSFFVSEVKKKHVMYSCLAAYNKNKAKKPIKITLRTEGEGIRVWRIE